MTLRSRWLATVSLLCVVVLTPSPLVAQRSTVLLRDTLAPALLVSVERLNDRNQLGVRLDGYALPNIPGSPDPVPRPKLFALTVSNAWLLRRDGTAVKQLSSDNNGRSGYCNAGACATVRWCYFERAASEELAGVVVSVDGTLYVREIAGKSN